MRVNILQTAVPGLLFGALATAAVLNGFTGAGIALTFGGVVAALWGDVTWGWLQRRMNRANDALILQQSVADLADQHMGLLRVHRQLVLGMSELRDIVAEVPMPDHTRRILMASFYQTADRMLTVLDEFNDDDT
jgi:hypothetical protein